MNTDINSGDRAEITRTLKGGFHNGRYLATVMGFAKSSRIKVKDDEGNEYLPFLSNARKLI